MRIIENDRLKIKNFRQKVTYLEAWGLFDRHYYQSTDLMSAILSVLPSFLILVPLVGECNMIILLDLIMFFFLSSFLVSSLSMRGTGCQSATRYAMPSAEHPTRSQDVPWVFFCRSIYWT